MKQSTAARIFGTVLIVAVALWDMDAMIPHIEARSWLTLGYVSIFLIGHVLDYMTVGRIVNRLPETLCN